MCGATFANPTVSNLAIEKSESPFGLKLTYDVSGAEGIDTNRVLAVSMSVDGQTFVATNLTGATSGDLACANGAHTIFWPLEKYDRLLQSANPSVTVAYQYPRYCVINFPDRKVSSSEDITFPVSFANVEPSDGFNTKEYKTTKLVLKRVEPGSFIMDKNPDDETKRVTLTKPFYLGIFEVTQKQAECLPDSTNNWWYQITGNDLCPQVQMNYNRIRGIEEGAKWPESNSVDTNSLLGVLRKRTGLAFDLPTEAQWVYACSAGSTTLYSYGDTLDDSYMWYVGNAGGVNKVGMKLPNAWGFYDMHGNVWEWCLDWRDTLAYGVDPKGAESGTRRMARGGSCMVRADMCSLYGTNARPSVSPDVVDSSIGFRLALPLENELTNVYETAVWQYDPLVAVSDLTIEKVESDTQTGFKLSYVLNGIKEGDTNRVLEVSMTIAGETIVATNLTGATSSANGEHVVFWPMAKTDRTFTTRNATVSVAYKFLDYCVIDIAGGQEASSYPITFTNAASSADFNTAEYKTTKIVLKRVDPGTFIMGKEQTDESHRVTLTRPFYMGLFEFTQKQWQSVSPVKPEPYESTRGIGDDYPAYNFYWTDIRGETKGITWPQTRDVDRKSLMGQLRAKTALAFDLPTEAQWEYTCRAGCPDVYSYGGDNAKGDYMWYAINASNKTHTVGMRLPNDWGFYDMHGNINEFCLDYYNEYDGVDHRPYGIDPKGSATDPQNRCRVARGGYYDSSYDACYSDSRDFAWQDEINWYRFGFRLALPLEGVVTNAVSATVPWRVEAADPFPEVAEKATSDEVAAALDGVADPRIKENVKKWTAYQNYRAWVDKVAGTDLADDDAVAKRQAIKDAAHAYLAYALDLDYNEAIALAPKQGDLVIATFANGAAGDAESSSQTSDGAWTLTVSLAGATVGADASMANLMKVFQVEAATSLADLLAGANNATVSTTFAAHKDAAGNADGKVSITVTPTDTTASTFFLRVKLTP